MSETKEQNVNGYNGISLEMLIVEAVDFFKRGRDWIRMTYLRWQIVAEKVAFWIDKRKLLLRLPSAEDCRSRYKKYTKGTKIKQKKAVFRQLTVKKTLVNNETLDDTLFDDFDIPISEKYILEMLTSYWPNGKVNLTPKIIQALIRKIMRCIPTEEKLREQIRTAWKQKDKLMSKEMLQELQTKRAKPKKKKAKKKTTRLIGNTLKQRFKAVKDQVAQETTKVISPATPMSEPKRFYNFRINQGNIGICYMVAVIVLFQNEFSILHKLKEIVNSEKDQRNKVDQTIKDLVTFLDTNYRYSFNNKCPKKLLPKLPKTWEKSVYQTDNTAKRSDIVSGGDHNFLLTFIFAKLDAWHDSFNVAFDYDYMSDDVVRMTKTEKGASFDYNDTTTMTMLSFTKAVDKFEKDKKHNIALIEMTFGNNAQEQLKVGDANPFKMVDNMARLPTVRGFIVRVAAGIGKDGHVVAGTVDNVSGKVPQEVVYCNSWGEKVGCDDSDTINTGLMKVDDQLKITTIHFVLRKQNFDFRNIERNISSSGEDSSDDPVEDIHAIFSSDEYSSDEN